MPLILFQSEERLPMKFSKLVELISKKQIPAHTKHLIVEIMVCDEEGEDVEVRLWLPLTNVHNELTSDCSGALLGREPVMLREEEDERQQSNRSNHWHPVANIIR